MKNPLLILMFLFVVRMPSAGQVSRPVLDPAFASGQGKISATRQVERASTGKLRPVDPLWRADLSYSVVSKNESPEFEEIEKRKRELLKTKFQAGARNHAGENATAGFLRPILGQSFNGDGNQTGGCPHDNTIAISNGGVILSLTNSVIRAFDETGQLIGSATLVDFYSIPTLSTNICDPKVLYDPQADRFIFYTQTCDGMNNNVVISFSTSNNPMDNWNNYVLAGDLTGGGDLFDYPKIGITNTEFFYTGNLFNNTGFSRAMVVQMNKNDGYSGNTVDFGFYDNIPGGPFTIMPVSHGHGGTYGPGMFLICTVNSAGVANVIHLFEITGDLGSNPVINHFVVNTTNYSVGAPCEQSGSTQHIDNGDLRALDGYFLNNTIHFVFTCDAGGGWNGINYNRLNVVTRTNQSVIFADPTNFDFCYPAIANGAANANDGSSVIIFGRTSGTIFPQIRVVAVDNNLEFSPSVLVKQGEGEVTNCFDPVRQINRWGDYSGSSRKYNGFPALWMSGSFGNGNLGWETWIAKIGLNVGMEVPEKPASSINVFPNPAVEIFNTRFVLDRTGQVAISLMDREGRLIKSLYEGTGVKGENTFSFNQGCLTAGTYFVSVTTEAKTCHYEKLVVAD